MHRGDLIATGAENQSWMRRKRIAPFTRTSGRFWTLQPLTTRKSRSLCPNKEKNWCPTTSRTSFRRSGPPKCVKWGETRVTILFMGLHRSGQIPLQCNKNANWIYWIQGVCRNESLTSFVFWFGRMMLRFLHGNPLCTSCRLALIVTRVLTALKIRGHIL